MHKPLITRLTLNNRFRFTVLRRLSVRLRTVLLTILLGSLLSACATMGPDGMPVDDPLESINQSIFATNDKLDHIFLDPLIRAWRFITPAFFRKGLHNLLQNLATPGSAANAALQGDLEGTLIELERFLVNSTLGIGGLFDVASMTGLAPRNEDFGQTLAVWGVPAGPYLMLPLFGPRTLRDLTGNGVDALADPINYVGANAIYLPYATSVLDFWDDRDQAHEAIQEGRKQIDPYTALRRIYLSHRLGLIHNGKKLEQTSSENKADSYDDYEDYDDYGDYDDYYEDYGDDGEAIENEETGTENGP